MGVPWHYRGTTVAVRQRVGGQAKGRVCGVFGVWQGGAGCSGCHSGRGFGPGTAKNCRIRADFGSGQWENVQWPANFAEQSDLQLPHLLPQVI